MRGVIDKYDEDRKFGFIAAEDGRRYFVHVLELDHAARFVGAHVSFTPTEAAKGPRATNVRLAPVEPPRA